MSFENISFLRDIDKIYKRYFSGAYKKSLSYIRECINNFEILKLLAEYWRKNNLFDKPIPQRSAFEAFYKTFENTEIILIELLEEDFYEHEGKKLRL